MSYADKFRTAVWTLQVTSKTSLNSLEETAAFNFQKIKAERPLGPYRFTAYSQTRTEAITEMMSRDGNPGPLLRSLKKLNHAWHGNCDNDIIQAVSQYFKSYLTAVSVFAYTLTTRKDGQSSMEAMSQWLQTVKTPISVIVALEGCLGLLLEEDKQEWRDLGAKRYLPNARVVFVDGGHYEFLTDDKVIRFLQEGY